MNFDEVMRLIGRWGGTLKFFPSDVDARIGIAEEIVEMARDLAEVGWLVKRLPKLHEDWPGVLEMRAAFCARYRPKDGIEAYSGVYRDGIPSEKASFPAIAAPPARQLSAGVGNGTVSNSPSIAATLSDLVRAKDLNRTINNISTTAVREIPVVKITEENRITYEEIQRVVREVRERKARIEAGLEDSAEKPE